MAVPVVNNPCPESWEKMSPNHQGRFCGKCSKIVIDFTKKTTQEILDFLKARKGEDICGKLRPSATLRMTRTFQPQARIFAAALYFVFGSMLFTACGPSEHEEPVGKVGIDSATQAQQQRYYDSVANADSVKPSGNQTPTETTEIDSAKMMEMMKLLDSVSAAKKN